MSENDLAELLPYLEFCRQYGHVWIVEMPQYGNDSPVHAVCSTCKSTLDEKGIKDLIESGAYPPREKSPDS
jgi:hypothetical protein